MIYPPGGAARAVARGGVRGERGGRQRRARRHRRRAAAARRHRPGAHTRTCTHV